MIALWRLLIGALCLLVGLGIAVAGVRAWPLVTGLLYFIGMALLFMP